VKPRTARGIGSREVRIRPRRCTRS
jgi:hypothetical protein